MIFYGSMNIMCIINSIMVILNLNPLFSVYKCSELLQYKTM